MPSANWSILNSSDSVTFASRSLVSETKSEEVGCGPETERRDWRISDCEGSRSEASRDEGSREGGESVCAGCLAGFVDARSSSQLRFSACNLRLSS